MTLATNTPGDRASVLEITPARVEGTIRVPGSKSLTNRALVVAALAEGESAINGALFSEDTEYMSLALRDLGFSVQELPDEKKFEDTTHGLIEKWEK